MAIQARILWRTAFTRSAGALEKQRVVDRHWEVYVTEVARAHGRLELACLANAMLAAVRPQGRIVKAVRKIVPKLIHCNRINYLFHAELANLHTSHRSVFRAATRTLC